MTDDFGTPVTPVTPPKKNNQTWLIVIIVLVVLCCCCVLLSGILTWNFGDYIMQWLGVY